MRSDDVGQKDEENTVSSLHPEQSKNVILHVEDYGEGKALLLAHFPNF
jgi:hypothetical protein